MEWTNMKCTIKRRRWELPPAERWDYKWEAWNMLTKKLSLHTSSTSFDTTIIFFSYGENVNNDTNLRKTGVIPQPNWLKRPKIPKQVTSLEEVLGGGCFNPFEKICVSQIGS